MLFLELKIFHVRLNKVDRIGNISSKKNEIALNENTSIKIKLILNRMGSTSFKKNEKAPIENTSCKVKKN